MIRPFKNGFDQHEFVPSMNSQTSNLGVQKYKNYYYQQIFFKDNF